YTILNRDKDHHAKNYDNAPMPSSERLTWDGVALHAGGLPGYPESHGCVHLPSQFAAMLFGITNVGLTVVIASDTSGPVDAAHPPLIAPVSAASGSPDLEPRLGEGEALRWQPEKSTAGGPITLVVSGADRRILVFRSGVEIGRARIEIGNPEKPLGTEAFVLQKAEAGDTTAHKSSPSGYRWLGVALPGSVAIPLDLKNPERVAIPKEFVEKVFGVLEAGVQLFR